MEEGCQVVGVAVESRLCIVGAGLRSGCVAVELSLRLPRGGLMSVRGRIVRGCWREADAWRLEDGWRKVGKWVCGG